MFWRTVLSWELHYKSEGKVLPFHAVRACGGVEV